MTVSRVGLDAATGTVTASVVWSQTPELEYQMTMTSFGRLIELGVTAGEGHAVSSTRLRMAPFRQMQAAVRAHIEEFAEMASNANMTAQGRKPTAAELREYRQSIEPWKKAASNLDRRNADQRLAATAAMFEALLRQGSTKPYEELAKQLGITKKDAYNRMFQARERGMFTSEGRGVVGGQLTDKAKETLSGNHQAS